MCSVQHDLPNLGQGLRPSHTCVHSLCRSLISSRKGSGATGTSQGPSWRKTTWRDTGRGHAAQRELRLEARPLPPPLGMSATRVLLAIKPRLPPGSPRFTSGQLLWEALGATSRGERLSLSLVSSQQAHPSQGMVGAVVGVTLPPAHFGLTWPGHAAHVSVRHLPEGSRRWPAFLCRSRGPVPGWGLGGCGDSVAHLTPPPTFRYGGLSPGDSSRCGSGPWEDSLSVQNPERKMTIMAIDGNQPHLRAALLPWPCTWAHGSVWPPNRE